MLHSRIFRFRYKPLRNSNELADAVAWPTADTAIERWVSNVAADFLVVMQGPADSPEADRPNADPHNADPPNAGTLVHAQASTDADVPEMDE